jgi:hypothetical protein
MHVTCREKNFWIIYHSRHATKCTVCSENSDGWVLQSIWNNIVLPLVIYFSPFTLQETPKMWRVAIRTLQLPQATTIQSKRHVTRFNLLPLKISPISLFILVEIHNRTPSLLSFSGKSHNGV